MAGDEVATGYLFQGWLPFRAGRFSIEAAGMETSAGWRIEGAGHFTGENNFFSLKVRMGR